MQGVVAVVNGAHTEHLTAWAASVPRYPPIAFVHMPREVSPRINNNIHALREVGGVSWGAVPTRGRPVTLVPPRSCLRSWACAWHTSPCTPAP